MSVYRFKNKKHLSVLICVFAILLIAGAVYAAFAGILTFDGTATLSPATKLVIEPLELEVNYTEEGSYGEILITDGGQKAIITAHLMAPGDFLEFYFSVLNKGTTNAEIIAIDVTNEDDEIINITGDYEDLKNMVVDVGGSTGMFAITVEWDENHLDVDPEDANEYTFTITMDYGMAS